jgi:hypothetical protein
MKYKSFYLIAIVGAVILSSLSTAFVGAEDISGNLGESLCDPNSGVSISQIVDCPDTNATKLETKIGEGLGYAFMAAGALAVVFLIYGGLMFAMSGGDTEKVKKAKNIILYSVIGLALAVTANVITSLVTNTANNLFK